MISPISQRTMFAHQPQEKRHQICRAEQADAQHEAEHAANEEVAIGKAFQLDQRTNRPPVFLPQKTQTPPTNTASKPATRGEPQPRPGASFNPSSKAVRPTASATRATRHRTARRSSPAARAPLQQECRAHAATIPGTILMRNSQCQRPHLRDPPAHDRADRGRQHRRNAGNRCGQTLLALRKQQENGSRTQPGSMFPRRIPERSATPISISKIAGSARTLPTRW